MDGTKGFNGIDYSMGEGGMSENVICSGVKRYGCSSDCPHVKSHKPIMTVGMKIHMDVICTKSGICPIGGNGKKVTCEKVSL